MQIIRGKQWDRSMFRAMRRSIGRLASQTRGNTFAIVAAALIPITVMIGSGIDMSRAYMAKNRLQNACDAGSLAARRVMQNDTLSQSVIDTGRQFFNFNFPQGAYQTTTFTPSVTKPSTGVVRITASTRIRTMIMRMFGVADLPLNVDCDASLNFVNTDVVLVLDVTGSMDSNVPTGSGGSSIKKIDALRSAVLALYDELAPMQTQLEAQGLRLRYGIVPYSSTVNVGRLLYARDPSYIRSSSTYQTRVANFTTAETTTVHTANTPSVSSGWENYSGGSISTGSCQTWVQSSPVSGGGPAPTATTVTSYQGTSTSTTYVASSNWGWSGASDTSGSSRSCRRWRIITTTTYTTTNPPTGNYLFTNWTYQQAAIDTSTFKTPTGTITLATNGNGTMPASGTYDIKQIADSGTGTTTASYTWNGCIEERDTVSTITSASGYTVPSGANDLNVDAIPSSDATRWRPMLPEAIYSRTAGSTSTTNSTKTSTTGWLVTDYSATSGYYACPAEARRLQVWARTDLNTYLNTLAPIGGTYHDIGMIWGARFVSTGGVFADGCDTYNSMPCNRHIIFMTDGQQTAYCNVYSSYGIERNDMRVKGATNCTSDSQSDTNTADLVTRHAQRFKMICNQAKNLSASIWVVAFDTSLNANLTDCASNADQAKTTSNQAQLIASFRQIANQIGALRLTE